MHLPDGILTGPVMAGSAVLAAAGVAVGLRRMDADRVPRVGVLSSVFFVASLIHVPIPPASAHLVLNGLVGFLLGWAAFPALAAALLLQSVLFGFGGLTALGANVLSMAAPGVVCHWLFARRVRATTTPAAVFALAFAGGAVAIALSVLLVGATLYLSGGEFLGAVGALAVGHIPVLVIEGFVTAFAVTFLHRVRPELLRAPPPAPAREESPHA